MFRCCCCCGWFWCGEVFSIVCFCLFVVCVCVCVVCCVLCVVCFVLLCAVLLLCCVVVVLLLLCCVCVCGGCVQGLSAGPPCAGPPPPDRLRRTALPKFRSFFPSPATVFILFSLSCWSFSLNFGGVLKTGTLKCARLGSRAVFETPAAPPDRAAGARTRQPENSKRAHLSAPAPQTPPKFHEKDQKRGRKE